MPRLDLDIVPDAAHISFKDQQTETNKIKKMLNRYATKPPTSDTKSPRKISKQADLQTLIEYEFKVEQERMRLKKERR